MAESLDYDRTDTVRASRVLSQCGKVRVFFSAGSDKAVDAYSIVGLVKNAPAYNENGEHLLVLVQRSSMVAQGFMYRAIPLKKIDRIEKEDI